MEQKIEFTRIEPTEDKDRERAEIERQTQEYLARGGVIHRPEPVERTVSTVMTKEEVEDWRFKLAQAKKSAEQYKPKRDPDKVHQKKTMHGDLTGKRFGMLVALSQPRKGWWSCVCDCGGKCDAQTFRLTSGLKVMCHECVGKRVKVKIRYGKGGI